MPKILTLNARDTVLFDLAMESEGLSYAVLGADTRSLHQRTIDLLKSKDIEYASLRSALVPQTTADDVALVFDTGAIESGSYGADVAGHLLPLFDRRWRGSILVGDLIHDDQDVAFDLLESAMRLARSVEVRDSSQLYAVYLSNLSDTQRETLLAGLSTCPAFVGHIPAMCESRAKDWLSATLVNQSVKHDSVFIGPHEDDIEEASDRNLGSWPLDKFDYRSVSLPQTLCFHPFLSYKIERAVHPAFESDTLHGLATISDDPRPLGDFAVVVDPRKVEYLRTKRVGTLDLAGLTEATASDLERLIAAKISQNYVYELDYRVEYDVSKFDIVVEVDAPGRAHPVRVVVGLQYDPHVHELRMITMV